MTSRINISICEIGNNAWKDILSSIDKDCCHEEEIHLYVDTNNGNDLIIDVDVFNKLSSTAWLTFKMPNLGELIGKDYINDVYDIELAEWDIKDKINEIVLTIKNRLII